MKTFVFELFHSVFWFWFLYFLGKNIFFTPEPYRTGSVSCNWNTFSKGFFQQILKRPEVCVYLYNKLSFVIKWNLEKIPQFLSPLKKELCIVILWKKKTINTFLPISTGVTSIGTMLTHEQRSLVSHPCISRLQCCIKERFCLGSNDTEWFLCFRCSVFLIIILKWK